MTTLTLPRDAFAGWRDHLPRVLEAALWLVLAWQGARLAWLVVPVEPGHPGRATASPPPAASPALAAMAFDPFHPGARPAATGAAFTLHGIRGGQRPGAIIAGADGVQRAWQVGDALAPGVRLAAIGPADATLDLRGREVRLALLEADAADAHVAPGATSPPTTTGPAAAAAESGADGLRIDTDHPLLAAAGLRRGDVVLAVDGQAPGPDLLSTLPARLARGATVQLTVRRAGRSQVLHVQAPAP